MGRLTSDEFGYVGNLCLQAAFYNEKPWCLETGHIDPRKAMEYVYDTDDQDLVSASEVPGFMTLEERETCESLGFSMEQVLEQADDAHANCFMNGETALLQLMNSIMIKAALFHFIALFKDELAAETSKAA